MLELLEKIDTIPELPQVAYKIIEEANKEDINYEKFSMLIEGSPSLMLKIFQIINSPFYALPNKIHNLSQAIGLLGIKHVANLALTIFVINILKDFYKEDSEVVLKWKHIITFSNAAKTTSKNDALFLSALISKIPEYLYTIMLSEGYGKKIEFNLDFHEKAIEILSEKWFLSEETVNAIKNFHMLKYNGGAKSKDAVYLYASEIIADSLMLKGTKEGLLEKVGKLLKMTDEVFIENIKKIEENSKAVFSLFQAKESVDYTNLLTLFSEANSKIYKLLTENHLLLDKYISSNETLEIAFNNFPLGVILFEKDSLVLVNEEAIKIFSKIPKNMDDILDKKMQQTLDMQKNKITKIMTSLKNGVVVELSFIKLNDKFNRKLLFLKDMREELKLKNRYKRAKENYLHLINSVGVGICITNLKGDILFTNERFKEIFRREEKEFLKNDIKKFFPFTKNLQNIFDKLLRKEIEEFHEEVKSFDSKHNLIYLNLKISLYLEGSKIIGYQFLIDDITGKKELEAENKQLQQNRIAMEIAGTTAHEINQPLTSLLLSIDLLKDNNKKIEVSEKFINRIEISAKKIASIVKELSKITKYETRSYAKRHTILDLKSDNE